MTTTRGLLQNIGIMVALAIGLAVPVGCASRSATPSELRGEINEESVRIERLRLQEQQNPKVAQETYQAFLEKRFPLEPLTHYQKTLSQVLRAIQDDQHNAQFSRDAVLGFPNVYMREVLARVQAHQGLARLSLNKSRFAQAEQEATLSIKLLNERGMFLPFSLSTSLRESYRLLEESYRQQNLIGKALVAKLSAELLDDHLQSVGGVADFYLEKMTVFGMQARDQQLEVDAFISNVNSHRLHQNIATMNAVMGGMAAATGSIQEGLAAHGLIHSDGAMMQQGQSGQMNAQLSQLQSQLYMSAMSAYTGASQETFQVNTTPWAIPTFTQQLVSSRQGANTPTIMKGFATTAAQAGGASYQAGAQNVTQAMDTLAPYRQSGKADGAAAQVEKFAEVFNAFLTQVQEIKAAK